jgi:hypothetical protein
MVDNYLKHTLHKWPSRSWKKLFAGWSQPWLNAKNATIVDKIDTVKFVEIFPKLKDLIAKTKWDYLKYGKAMKKSIAQQLTINFWWFLPQNNK